MTQGCYFKDAHPDTIWSEPCDGPLWEEKNYGVDRDGKQVSRFACERHAKITMEAFPAHKFEKVEALK